MRSANAPLPKAQKCPAGRRMRTAGQNAILRGAGSAIQQGQLTALRAGTDSAVDQLAVLKDQQGGDAHDVELAGQFDVNSGILEWTRFTWI